MSHLHIPDGFLPLPLLFAGYVICALLVASATYKLRQGNSGENLSKIGAVSAFMLLAMVIPLGFLPVHMNLAVLCGIIVGPWSGIIAVFVVNLILGLTGHGGMTVLGLNTCIITAEMLVGYGLFRLLSRAVRPGRAAAASVAVALVCSLIITVSVLSMARLDPVEALVYDEQRGHGHGHAVGAEVVPSPGERLYSSVDSTLMVILPFASLGIAVEALIVAGIVGYLSRVRPDLIRTV